MDDQTIEDLKAIRAEAHRLEQPGMGYPMVSVRSIARDLGMSDRIDAILAACVEGGFEYCLDHTVECNGGGDRSERIRPTSGVCYWGPDQLRSRLDSLRNARLT